MKKKSLKFYKESIANLTQINNAIGGATSDIDTDDTIPFTQQATGCNTSTTNPTTTNTGINCVTAIAECFGDNTINLCYGG